MIIFNSMIKMFFFRYLICATQVGPGAPVRYANWSAYSSATQGGGRYVLFTSWWRALADKKYFAVQFQKIRKCSIPEMVNYMGLKANDFLKKNFKILF